MANILAVDSSSKNVSCALMIDTGIREISYTGSRSVSSTLLDQIDFLLQQSGIGKKELDCLALGAGPGSFTGMRVSFSLLKAVGDALALPVVCIDSLDTIAAPFLQEGATTAVFQRARKGYAYYAVYIDGIRSGKNLYLDPVGCAEKAITLPQGSIIAGDAVRGFFDLPDRNLVLCNTDGAPSARWLTRLALKEFEKKNFTPFERVLPEYMRPSDAEENADN